MGLRADSTTVEKTTPLEARGDVEAARFSTQEAPRRPTPSTTQLTVSSPAEASASLAAAETRAQSLLGAVLDLAEAGGRPTGPRWRSIVPSQRDGSTVLEGRARDMSDS